MQIFQSTAKGPLKVDGYIDPDDVTTVTVFWGAPAFTGDKVYRVGDIVRPPTDNGYYYECTQAGLSSHNETHTWPVDEHICGDVIFTAVPYDLWVLPDESLQGLDLIPASVWTATNGVTLANEANNAYSTSAVIQPLPEGVVEFMLTNQVRKSNGDRLSRSFKYKF